MYVAFISLKRWSFIEPSYHKNTCIAKVPY